MEMAEEDSHQRGTPAAGAHRSIRFRVQNQRGIARNGASDPDRTKGAVWTVGEPAQEDSVYGSPNTEQLRREERGFPLFNASR